MINLWILTYLINASIQKHLIFLMFSHVFMFCTSLCSSGNSGSCFELNSSVLRPFLHSLAIVLSCQLPFWFCCLCSCPSFPCLLACSPQGTEAQDCADFGPHSLELWATLWGIWSDLSFHISLLSLGICCGSAFWVTGRCGGTSSRAHVCGQLCPVEFSLRLPGIGHLRWLALSPVSWGIRFGACGGLVL